MARPELIGFRRCRFLTVGSLMADALPFPTRYQQSLIGADPTGTDPVGLKLSQIDANDISLHVVGTGEGATVGFCDGFPDTARTWQGEAVDEERGVGRC